MRLKNLKQTFLHHLLVSSFLIAPMGTLAQTTPSDGMPNIDHDLANRQWQTALTKLDRFVIKHPTNVQAKFKRATTLARLQRFDQAITQFKALIQAYPELPEPYNNLAVIYVQQGHLAQAKTLLTQSIQANPNYPLALENLADIELLSAQQHYLQAQKLAPLSQRSKNRLAQLQTILK